MVTIVIHILTTIAVVFASCGNMRNPDDVPQDFAGRWDGPSTVNFGGEAGPRTYESSWGIVVSGTVATVTGLCPDGTGTVRMGGFDGVVAFEQEISCRPSFLEGCLHSFVYTMGTARIVNGVLHLMASGHDEKSGGGAQCLGEAPLSLEFTGVHVE